MIERSTSISPRKPLVWLHGEVKSPPFATRARIECGTLLAELQHGMSLSMPESRPMPSVGSRCHELRIPDESHAWRIIYRVDEDAILILAVFSKKSAQTPRHVIESCRRRFKSYDHPRDDAFQ